MIERLRFAHLPTPIEPMPRLGQALGLPRLFVKRDDQTGLAMGGNKTRKLELLVAEAQANGARMLITAGAIQSNHCRQTAAAAARAGSRSRIIRPGHHAAIRRIAPRLPGEFAHCIDEQRDQSYLVEHVLCGIDIVVFHAGRMTLGLPPAQPAPGLVRPSQRRCGRP